MRRPHKPIENDAAEEAYAEAFHAMRAARETIDKAERKRHVATARRAWRECLLHLGMWLSCTEL